MKQSPVKFDDLAFILLFFFMILAVISLSNEYAQENPKTQSNTDQKTITVYLNQNGQLSSSDFSQKDNVELVCHPALNWETIQNTVKDLSQTCCSVTLVIQ